MGVGIAIARDVTHINIDTFTIDEARTFTWVILPPGLVSIGESAFRCFYELEAILIPDTVTTIETAAFDGCSLLRSIVIPHGVTKIGMFAFHHCHGVQSFVIPASVTELGLWPFEACRDLERVWNKSECKLVNKPMWSLLGPGVPTPKELLKWTFAMHWHWLYPDRIVSKQRRRFVLILHCCDLPLELSQLVWTFIPRRWGTALR
jgi:hypothetical protein